MGAQHTPGPWKAESTIYKHMVSEVRCVLPGSETGVAQVWRKDGPEGLANSLLIAAAPDLLEACKRAREFIENGVALGFIRLPDPGTPDPAHDTLPAIDAALAKAEGRR